MPTDKVKLIGFGAVVIVAFLLTIFIIKNVGVFKKVDETPQEVVETHENVKVIKLVGVGGRASDALASKGFTSGVFSANVSANLTDPEAGMFYEAWLVEDFASKKYFSLGKLQKAGDKYNLTFTDTKDYPDHKIMIVSSESNASGLDSQMETRVLSGSF